MKIPVRWKLMASYLLLVLVMAGAQYGHLVFSIEKLLLNEITESLASEGRLAQLLAARDIRSVAQDGPAVASAIAKAIRSRVSIVSSDGTVVGDSDVSPRDLGGLENHLSRPEIRQALQSGHGSSIRYSSTTRTPMLYVAHPFRDAAGESAVIRVALPLSAIEKTKASYRTMIGISLALSVLVAILFSYLLSNITSRSLRRIASMASQLARGELRRRIRIPPGDEVGELAGVLNRMADRIEMQVDSLSAEKNRLDTIVRGMGEGLLVTDGGGVVTLVNPAFGRMFDLGSEVEGKSLIDLSRHPGLHASFRRVVETAAERFEELVLGTSGEERILLTHWVPLLDDQGIQGVVAVFNDISDLKKLERIRRDFVANVSHELRTPIAVIKGYAETLLSGAKEDPASAEKFIGIIHTHSERLANLVSDLLALSEMESGGLILQLSAVELAPALARAVRLLEEQAAGKRISVTVDAGSGQRVAADSVRLEQILLNLLDNAIKYTPEGGAVTISSTDAGDSVRISFTDTGIGIPPRDIPRIFERFYRVDPARSRDLGGTGLGLSIVKHLVQLHGGAVEVESSSGRGSTFAVTLPKPRQECT